ncbi:MAG TPA: hypothetical protein VFL51_15830 [Pseudolabrys sp.]|nr:hypothetical protein [Pseudolabrys sp.]
MITNQKPIASRFNAGIRRVYDTVETALWAALFAFILYFAAFVGPRLPEIRAQMEQSRAEEIAAEHRVFCRRWLPVADEHTLMRCMGDLQEFRARVEQRMADENPF